MYQLTPTTDINIIYQFVILAVIGGLIFSVVFILLMSLLFGISVTKNTKNLAIVLAVSFSVPLFASAVFGPSVYRSQAQPAIELTSISTNKVNEGVALQIVSSKEVFAYIKYTDNATKLTKVILSQNGGEEVLIHDFFIPVIGQQGGTVEFIIDGQSYLLNEKPFEISP